MKQFYNENIIVYNINFNFFNFTDLILFFISLSFFFRNTF